MLWNCLLISLGTTLQESGVFRFVNFGELRGVIFLSPFCADPQRDNDTRSVLDVESTQPVLSRTEYSSSEFRSMPRGIRAGRRW